MIKNMRCPNCGRARKPSHEKNIKETGCPRYRASSEESKTWPEKPFTGGGLIRVTHKKVKNPYKKGRGVKGSKPKAARFLNRMAKKFRRKSQRLNRKKV